MACWRLGQRIPVALGTKQDVAPTWMETIASNSAMTIACCPRSHRRDKITGTDVKAWQLTLRKNLEAGTVNGALIMLRMVLADAVAEFRLSHNPAARVKRLPVKKFTDEEPNLLSAEELGRVLAGFREHKPKHYPLAVTLALTGLRYGGATALKWSDLDQKSGVIRIRRAQWKGVVDTTKTGTVRSVPLVPELAEVLKEHRAATAASGLSARGSAPMG